MREFLKSLGITRVGHYSNKGYYVIDLNSDVELAKCFSQLSHSNLVDEVEDKSIITVDSMSQVFESDEYEITLLSDFNADRYQIVVKEY